jgi:hypothetical protein
LGYVTELVSLINTLVEKRLLVIIPLDASPELVIGRKASRWYKPGLVVVDEKEYVQVDRNMFDWLNSKGEQIYWPVNCPEKTLPVCKTIYSWFTVSQELKDLVEHNFETEEERRFIKQQQLTWISIAVTAFIGIAGLIIAIISICR